MKIEEQRFRHRVSKGSRYNQIYIPKGMQGRFGIGDLVEVRLIEKKDSWSYQREIAIGNFKEKLIKQIFAILREFRDIEQVIIFGSFLTQNEDYRDIDIAILTNKKGLEEKVYSRLTEEMPLKFHVISFDHLKLKEILEFCPLTRSMFYYAISNKKLEIPKKTYINKEHLEFLLMMPEDIINIPSFSSRVYFDSLRKLITILRFLKNQDLDPLKINFELKSILGQLYEWSRNNEVLNEASYQNFKHLILIKLKEVRSLLNGAK
jgi:predicted nucleotidyltransferase